MPRQREKYGCFWADDLTDIEIELSAIRKGGRWKLYPKDTREYGLGIEYHFEQACRILWPWIDAHRWHNLCRDAILQNKVSVIMGPGSSNKTNSAAWVYLVDYYSQPDKTCVLVSSTDMRGLELRVWGEIKMLHEQAQDQYPDKSIIPGFLVDSRKAIFTHDVNDEEKVRDQRAGLIGVPCVQGGKWVGLGKYCFVQGTLVDTPSGPKPIESIKVGDEVISAIGPSRVSKTFCRTTDELVRVNFNDGTHIDCTSNHRFLTPSGWIEALDIPRQTDILSPDETVQIMRESHSSRATPILQHHLQKGIVGEDVPGMSEILHTNESINNFLLQVLRLEMPDGETWDDREDYSRKESVHNREEHKRRIDEEHSGEETKEHKIACLEQAKEERIEVAEIYHNDDNSGRNGSFEVIPKCGSQFYGPDWKKLEDRKNGPIISNRFSLPGSETGGRSGWKLSPDSSTENKGQEARRIFDRKRVVSIEVHELHNSEASTDREVHYRVHNLEVEGHPSYSVNNCVVHNCGIKQKRMRLLGDEASFMNASFLSSFANLDKNEDFRATLLGNPVDILDVLGKAAEPLEGWSAHLEPTKTDSWKTRFMGGVCVNLVGTDSPNFDYPEDQPTKYPYLISREKIANTLSFFPKDSAEYLSQCLGTMKIGMLTRRVITRDLCIQFGARDPAVWAGAPRTKIFALDAAYGGDRCVGGHIEFGRDVNQDIVIDIHPPLIIPIIVKTDQQPEDQIAEWVKEYIDTNDIPPENIFHDSTGRGGLGTALARIISDQCNPVEFGGPPTTRPVSLDLFVYDSKERRKRPKLCNEHYDRFVTELWWSVRLCIESRQLKNLPEDVMEEMCMREWDKIKENKIKIETKKEMKARVGRSPDLGDWAGVALEGARRRGFQIKKLGNTDEASQTDWSWLTELKDKANRVRQAHELHRV